MNFQGLQKVENADFYLDIAFRSGKKQAVKTRENVRGDDRLRRTSVIESERIKAASKTLHGHLNAITEGFPMIDELPPFYRELTRCTIDIDKLKKSIGAIKWADSQAMKFFRMSYSRIRNSKDPKSLYVHKKSYYGRVSSALKQVKDAFLFLESARRMMKKFPAIKTDLPTIVIAGFPNVGKTTLLRALTGSEPKIASYPFTTQSLMIGYAEIGGKKMQMIDTPGLLDRPLNRRNKIELQAILALKHLANKIIFVLDPTESSGYSYDEQIQLLRSVEENFRIPTIIAMNKSDLITDERDFKELRKYTKVIISAEKKTGIKELAELLG